MKDISDHFRTFSFQRVNGDHEVTSIPEMTEFLCLMGYKTKAMSNDDIYQLFSEIQAGTADPDDDLYMGTDDDAGF